MPPKKRVIVYYNESINLSAYEQKILNYQVELIAIKKIEEFFFNKDCLSLFLLDYDFIQEAENKKTLEDAAYTACVILLLPSGKKPEGIEEDLIIQYLEDLDNSTLFLKALENGFKRLGQAKKITSLDRRLIIREGELQELQAIGVSLSTEKNIHTLLKIILRFAVDITGADAGSLYLVEKNEKNKKILRFALNQNYSIKEKADPFVIPLDKTSIAGYVAATNQILNIKDSYHLPAGLDCQHSREFDEKYHYMTKSILTFPMDNRKDEVIGVIQLINKKNRLDKTLKTPSDFEECVSFFTETDEQMVYSLASQAAVALENAILYESIQKLFDGFVKASVGAIESRDPTTSGHSERVAIYSVQLAKALSETNEGPYKEIRFSEDQLKELRYAALLHDFGKVGVRENVLTKAKKLYPEEINLLTSRIYYIKRDITAKSLMKKIDLISSTPKLDFIHEFELIDKELEQELKKLDFYLKEIIRINEPLPLQEEDTNLLEEIKNYQYIDPVGQRQFLLSENEHKKLSIRMGSLDEQERKEIESHVSHSYDFLKRIPWTQEMQNIPEIAYRHHEKLSGKGYPLGVTQNDIPIQSRIISIADIYDALTASDRPYKKALPLEKALQILEFEAKAQNLDPELLRIFIHSKAYEKTPEKTNQE